MGVEGERARGREGCIYLERESAREREKKFVREIASERGDVASRTVQLHSALNMPLGLKVPVVYRRVYRG